MRYRLYFIGPLEGIFFFGYRKVHRTFLPNSLLVLLAEFGGRFKSLLRSLQNKLGAMSCDITPNLLARSKGFSSLAIGRSTGPFSQTLCSFYSQSLEVVSNPFFAQIRIKQEQYLAIPPLFYWPARRDLNPRSSESESAALSSCATSGNICFYIVGEGLPLPHNFIILYLE